MEKSVSVYEAKTQLSKLLELVAEGQAVTITNRGRPVATLNPILKIDGPMFGFLKDQFPNLPSYTDKEWEEADQLAFAIFSEDD